MYAAGALVAAFIAITIAALEAQGVAELRAKLAGALEGVKIETQLKIETGWRVQAMSSLIDSVWPEDHFKIWAMQEPSARIFFYKDGDHHGEIARDHFVAREERYG